MMSPVVVKAIRRKFLAATNWSALAQSAPKLRALRWIASMTLPVPEKKNWLVLVMIVTTFFFLGCRSNSTPTPTTETSTAPFVVITPPPPSIIATAVLPSPPPTISPETPAQPEPTATTRPNTITVGSQPHTEQLILGKMLVRLLQEAGYNVIDRTGFGGAVAVRTALEAGEIDLMIEDTSSALAIVHELPATSLPSNANRAHELAKSLDKQAGLSWLNRLALDNHYVLVVDAESAEAGLHTLTDLANFVNEKGNTLRFCTDAEFYARTQDGLVGVQTYYGFALNDDNVVIMGSDQLFTELHASRCDVAVGRSTDGHIEAWGLYPLEDNLGFFPTNTAAPVVATTVLEREPELANVLNRLGVRLSSQAIRQLNARVDLGADGEANSGDEETAVSVAQSFLEKAGLFGDTPQIVVATTDDPLQLLLAEMSLLLLAETEYDLAPLSPIATPHDGYSGLQSSALDLIWTYSGVALRDFYRLPVLEFPDTTRLIYDEAAQRGAADGLLWLEKSTVGQQTAVFVNPVAFTPTPGTLPDLATLSKRQGDTPTLCVATSFYDDPDGLVALFDAYDFTIPEASILFVEDSAERYQLVGEGICQVGIGDKLNGRLNHWSLQTLADPLDFFANDSLTPIIRQTTAYAYPQIGEQLAKLTAVLDTDSVNQMLDRIEFGADRQRQSGDEEAVQTIAELYLCSHGLLARCPAPTVVATNQTENCQNPIVNGDFEAETGWIFAETAVSASYSSLQAHQGQWAARLGSSDRNTIAGTSSFSQALTLPENTTSATLTYWFYPASRDFVGGDAQAVAIYDETFTTINERLHWTVSNEQAWIRQTHDLTAYSGQTIHLYFATFNDGDSIPTFMLIDDVVVEVCSS